MKVYDKKYGKWITHPYLMSKMNENECLKFKRINKTHTESSANLFTQTRKLESKSNMHFKPIHAHRSNICFPRDWRLSDSKYWNGWQKWVLNYMQRFYYQVCDVFTPASGIQFPKTVQPLWIEKYSIAFA